MCEKDYATVGQRGGVQTRRCFMSGEYCAKQANITQERRKLHDKRIINAFVIMNFSDMSDVVYKWRLNNYIKTLADCFCLNIKTGEVKVSSEPLKKEDVDEMEPKGEWEKVKGINVLRADSDSATNYVVCDRVCQQMQIADLIVVDVTVENANVFYEFGLAVAMGKLILPICYSESFYYRIPPAIKSFKKKSIEKHIDCFPWRRRLFEHYGLLYKGKDRDVKYIAYDLATKAKKGNEPVFQDQKYCHFPFNQGGEVTIGRKLYDALLKSYKDLGEGDNTLVVYTMDDFLNGEEGAACICNFYNFMTSKVKESQCFCGDRVVTLVQEDITGEENKDSREKNHLPYQIGDLIHIGVNQATYVAQRDKIVDTDFLASYASDEQYAEEIRTVKKHISNRSLMIPLNPPIYVDHALRGLQKGVFEEKEGGDPGRNFCFFHILLRTLRYANEIVVDISNNRVEALFWLGMAHGADVNAIAVINDHPDWQRGRSAEEKNGRKVFDVAGLWTAVMKENDTEGFYRQLALAQTSIEQRSKLMLKNADEYAEEMLDWMRGAPYLTDVSRKIDKTLKDKREDEEKKLESYYRNRFWAHLIEDNNLQLFLQQKKDPNEGTDKNPYQLLLSKWDVDALSELSHYLSKRKANSGSKINALRKNGPSNKTADELENFISVGAYAKPLKKDADGSEYISLAEHINSQKDRNTDVRILNSSSGIDEYVTCPGGKEIRRRGFMWSERKIESHAYGLLPNTKCFDCPSDKVTNEHTDFWLDGKCRFAHPKENEAVQKPKHTQVAQVLMWRETQQGAKDDVKDYIYQMSLIGASGPSTYALTSLFVDEYQKKDIIPSGDSEHHLIKLQREVRKSIMDEYEAALDGVIKPEIIRKIRLYLSTVMYRYFFPFLSKADENRITNGLTAYLSSFEHTVDSQSIVSTLGKLLTSVRGIEAIYSVDVQVENGTEDDRTILNIKPWESDEKNENPPYLTCLYIGEGKKKK